MLMVGCTQRPINIDDLYLEAWIALEALTKGNYNPIPVSKKISITTTEKTETQCKVITNGLVNKRKMAFCLTYPNELLKGKDTFIIGSDSEFIALRKCVDKFISGSSEMGSCSVTSLIINGEKGATIVDRIYAPHMDIWVKNIDQGT
jgi:hypothetical protein